MGLRRPERALTPASDGSPVGTTHPSMMAPSTALPTPPSPVTQPPDQRAARAAAQAALDKLKPTLVQKCWTPATERAPEPRTSKYVFMVSFDGAGKEIGRGVS